MKAIEGRHWKLIDVDEDKVKSLQNELNISDILSRLMVQRSIETYDEAKRFFKPKRDYLHDPLKLRGIEGALLRLELANKQAEHVMIYGDYDVDGTTSIALLYSFLHPYFGDKLTYYVPDRISEGYGLSFVGIDTAHNQNVSLIIALDCGTSQYEKVEYAKAKQIDVIVCDHHIPPSLEPNTVALINPKHPNCPYPYKELSACGLVFKFIQALSKTTTFHTSEGDVMNYLDYVAVSTCADIVPITDENRLLVHFGIQQLLTKQRPCFKSFLGDKKTLTVSDIVFDLSPKINAAGRLVHAKTAIEFLLCKDQTKADEMYHELSHHNDERKKIQNQIYLESVEQVEKMDDTRSSIVVRNKAWEKGVIGIVASKLVETYYRPSLVFSFDKSKNQYVGSGRATDDINLYDLLSKCKKHIVQYGGHAHAVGLTVANDAIESFMNEFENQIKTNDSFVINERKPTLPISAELPLSKITPKFVNTIQRMAPFGPQNHLPIFVARGVKHNGYVRTMGEDSAHLKLLVYQQSNALTYNCIGFNFGYHCEQIKASSTFDIAFVLEYNTFRGEATIQLRLKGISNFKS